MRLVIALGVFGAAALTVFVGFLGLLHVTVHPRDVDCGGVQLPAPGAWTTLDGHAKEDLAGDLEQCHRFDGLSTSELTTSLGPPDAQGTQGNGSTLWVYTLPHSPTASGVTTSPDELRLTLAADQQHVDSAYIERATYD